MTLPPTTAINLSAESHCHAAYARCVSFEQTALTDVPPGQFSEKIAARLLGYLLIYVPSDQGRDVLSHEIMSCVNNEALFDLGRLYEDHFLRCFRRMKGPTPAPSYNPSQPSFNEKNTQTCLLEWEETRREHAIAKQLALVRDGFRCVLTGAIDVAVLKLKPPPPMARTQNPTISTQACHIFPHSINTTVSGDSGGGYQHNYATSVWAVMDRLGQVLRADESTRSGININALDNVLTMDYSKHLFFSTLDLWFEATGRPNQYNIRATHPRYLDGIISPITLTSTDPTTLPVASPRYLGLHAAAAQVAHLSGAGECLDQFLRDLEDARVVTDDGQFTAVLTAALSLLPREISSELG